MIHLIASLKLSRKVYEILNNQKLVKLGKLGNLLQIRNQNKAKRICIGRRTPVFMNSQIMYITLWGCDSGRGWRTAANDILRGRRITVSIDHGDLTWGFALGHCLQSPNCVIFSWRGVNQRSWSFRTSVTWKEIKNLVFWTDEDMNPIHARVVAVK